MGRGLERLDMKNGAPGEIRTPDLLVRSQTLYPTELRAHPNKDTLKIAQNFGRGKIVGEAKEVKEVEEVEEAEKRNAKNEARKSKFENRQTKWHGTKCNSNPEGSRETQKSGPPSRVAENEI